MTLLFGMIDLHWFSCSCIFVHFLLLVIRSLRRSERSLHSFLWRDISWCCLSSLEFSMIQCLQVELCLEFVRDIGPIGKGFGDWSSHEAGLVNMAFKSFNITMCQIIL